MPIGPDRLKEIDQLLAEAAADRTTLAKLRSNGAGVTAILCDAVDVADETPFRSYARCNLYLLDGREHCVKVTDDPAIATGLIIAAKGGSA